MPFIYPLVKQLEGETKAGDGDCVDLIKKYVPGLKTASAVACWRRGINVYENRLRIAPGTAIATFDDDRYSNNPSVSKHAAIYIGPAGGSGIWVMDQWKKSPMIASRLIRIALPREKPGKKGRWENASNVAQAFYVIEIGSCSGAR